MNPGLPYSEVSRADIRLRTMLTLSEWMMEYYPHLFVEEWPEDFHDHFYRYYSEDEVLAIFEDYALYLPTDALDPWDEDEYEFFEPIERGIREDDWL